MYDDVSTTERGDRMAFRDGIGGQPRKHSQKNVLGLELQQCSVSPLTGFYRDGCCNTGSEDRGLHTVCAVMTAEFLEFSAMKGNDLSTAVPEYGFPGLKPGDRWCLCAMRWREAFEHGAAPLVVLAATNAVTLEVVHLDDLKRHALDLN
jgi:uncharacterized protein